MSQSATSRRWVIWQSKLDESALVEYQGSAVPGGDDRDLFERIEVMPVAEHEAEIDKRGRVR